MICNFKLGFEKRMMSGVKYTKFATVLLLSAGLSACAAERETVVRASAEADRPAVSQAVDGNDDPRLRQPERPL